MRLREGIASTDGGEETPEELEQLLHQFHQLPEDLQLRFLQLAFDSLGEPATADAARRKLSRMLDGAEWGPGLGQYPPVH